MLRLSLREGFIVQFNRQGVRGSLGGVWQAFHASHQVSRFQPWQSPKLTLEPLKLYPCTGKLSSFASFASD